MRPVIRNDEQTLPATVRMLEYQLPRRSTLNEMLFQHFVQPV